MATAHVLPEHMQEVREHFRRGQRGRHQRHAGRGAAPENGTKIPGSSGTPRQPRPEQLPRGIFSAIQSDPQQNHRSPPQGSDSRVRPQRQAGLFTLRKKRNAISLKRIIFYCTSKYRKESFSAVTPVSLSITAFPCSSQLLRGRVSATHGSQRPGNSAWREQSSEEQPPQPLIRVPAGHGAYGNMGFIPHTQPWAISLMFPMLWAPLSHPGPPADPE